MLTILTKTAMFTKHLPAELLENWVIAEIDDKNDYLEFQGFDGEFLISIIKDSYENPEEPFHLCMNQLKGLLSRYDFENLDWPEWFVTDEDSLLSAFDLMNWINENYSNFAPVTLGVLVSLGTEDQLPIIKKYYEDQFTLHEIEDQRMVFKKVNLLRGSSSYSESAIESLRHFAICCNLNPFDLKGGIMTNEKFQIIDDLRALLAESLNTHETKSI